MNNSLKYISLLLFILFNTSVFSQVFIDFKSEWNYFKGVTDPSDPFDAWKNPGFDISGWETGNAPFGYGYAGIETQLDDMSGSYSTLYLLKEIQISDLSGIDDITISVAFDDGYILWINGNEVARKNAPSYSGYRRLASNSNDADELVKFMIPVSESFLNAGTNTIALQGFNVSAISSDFYLGAKLEGSIRLPETESVICNTPSGFFENPFSINFTTETPGEIIKYTLDGSDPRISPTAIETTSPATVNVDPSSNEGNRGITGGFVVRASHFKEGFSPSKPTTRNYIFVDHVKTQQHPGGSWPTFYVNGQVIDLEMDQSIINDDNYKDLINNSLLDIPSISITTDLDNLFGSSNGIYVNAQYHGYEWERPANIELINPDGSDGFNIDAGLRIRGGYSRHDGYPKHAFRLFFRSEYGKGKLDFPLFGDEGTNEFDKVDLRTSQNYSWANGGSASKYNTMNRDVFSRESQRDIGQPYTRSRYYHLYLNGLYWGIYQTQERADANFAESYLGGDDDDYDVVKVDIGDNWNLYVVEATDGNLNAWEEVWDITQQGYTSNLNYFKLIGQTPNGIADTSLTEYVDIDNLIDYMLVIFYGGNFDSPVSKFMSNRNPNNFFAINDRTDKRKGFKFLIHDAEHTLLTDPVGPGDGLLENRVNIGNTSMTVSSFSKFHPQWLHFKLSDNEEYKMKFADHVYKHFFNGGTFNPDSNIARFKSTSDQLDLAIIAESARWGYEVSPTRNKLDDWIPAVDQVINDWMPYRTEIVINQFIDENLYPEIDPPFFVKDNQDIWEEKIVLSDGYTFTLENRNQIGSIIYTTNGEDPRKVGGLIRETAIISNTTETIVAQPGYHIMARVKNGDTWSALHELVFEDSGLFSNLKVTELHYHPTDQDLLDSKDLEFIELKNTGNSTLDLSGLEFSEGIFFTFPEGTTIAPNSYLIVASNIDTFSLFYGFTPEFQFSGSLSNGGENILLETASGLPVISFTYSDDAPWPVEADGDGYSLVSVETNPTGDPNSHEYWTISKELNGSPAAKDANSVTGNTEIDYETSIDFDIYPNPSNDVVNLNFYLNSEKSIEIRIFDLNGRLLHIIPTENLPAGYYNRSLQLSTLGIIPGVYLINFQTSSNSITKKLIYNK